MSNPFFIYPSGAIAYEPWRWSGGFLHATDRGVDPTGVADSSAELQAAIDEATTDSKMLLVHGTVRLDSAIYITCNFDGHLSEFNCVGTNPNSIIVQANKTPNTASILSGCTIFLPKINNTTKPLVGWAGQGTGVLCRNLDNCQLYAVQVRDFVTGLYVSAYSNGTNHSTFYLGRLVNNQYNLLLKPDNHLGWVNQNVFLNGRMGAFESGTIAFAKLAPSGFGNASDFNPPNTNTFIGLSVEGEGDASGPNFHLSVAGIQNTFVNTRFEISSGVPRLEFVGDTVVPNLSGRNNFIGGYSNGGIVTTQTNLACTGNRIWGMGYQADHVSFSSTPFVNNPAGGDIQRVFKSTKNLNLVTASDTDWTVSATEDGFNIKGSADPFPAMRIQQGYIQIGDGSGPINTFPYMDYGGAIGLRMSSGLALGGYFRLPEMATPAAPPANTCYVYAKDNGAGKTQLMALFPTGAEQQIAIEP